MRKLFSGFTCSSRKKNNQENKIPKSVSISLDLSILSPGLRISEKEYNIQTKQNKKKQSDNANEHEDKTIISCSASKKINLMRHDDNIFIKRLKMTFSDLFDPRFNYERCVITSDFSQFTPKQRRIFMFIMIDQLFKFPSSKQYIISDTWLQRLKEFIVLNSDQPGPIYNDELFKEILPKSLACFAVNEYLWWFLVLCFGGGPEIKSKEGGMMCLDLIEKKVNIKLDEKITQKIVKIANTTNLRKRKEMENEFMRVESDTITTRLYLVDRAWIDGYQNYLSDGLNLSYTTLRNKKLSHLVATNEIKRDDYCLVNENVWYFLSQIYFADTALPVYYSSLANHVTDFEDYWEDLKEGLSVRQIQDTLKGIPLYKFSSLSQQIIQMGLLSTENEGVL